MSASQPVRRPGHAALVVEGGISRQSFAGLASIEWDKPIDAHTHFHVASLAKQFTALAVLQLQRRGQLRIDSAVGQYVDALSPAVGRLTLRQLLSHTSGLRDQWPLMELAGWRGNDPITTDDVLRVLRRQAAPHFPPGTAFMYSNSGYTLAAAAVANVAGAQFSEYISQEIFGPLGMRDSLIADDANEPVLRSASAYSQRGRRSSPNLFVAGSTSLVTTLADYEKWLAAHRPGSSWRPFIDEMQAVQVLDDGSEVPYGLAYFLLGDLALHTGNDFGFSAYMADYRDVDRQVAFFSNGSVGDLMAAVSSFVSGESPPDTHTPSRETPFAHNLAGAYESAMGEIRLVEAEGEALFVHWGGRNPLIAVGDGRLRADGGDIYEFDALADEPARSFRLSTPTSVSRWTRIKSQNRASLTPKAGLYWSDETAAGLEVTNDGRELSFGLPKQQARRLKRVDANRFAGDGLWTVVAPSEEALTVSLPRCLGVNYQRR